MNIETYGPVFELVQQAEWVNSCLLVEVTIHWCIQIII